MKGVLEKLHGVSKDLLKDPDEGKDQLIKVARRRLRNRVNIINYYQWRKIQAPILLIDQINLLSAFMKQNVFFWFTFLFFQIDFEYSDARSEGGSPK